MAAVQSDGVSLPILISHCGFRPGTGLGMVKFWRSEEGGEAGRAKTLVSERAKITRDGMQVGGGCIAATEPTTVRIVKAKRI